MEKTNRNGKRLGFFFWKEEREIRNVYKITNDQKSIDEKNKKTFPILVLWYKNKEIIKWWKAWNKSKDIVPHKILNHWGKET